MIHSHRYDQSDHLLLSEVNPYSHVHLDDHTTDNNISAVDHVNTTEIDRSMPGEFLDEFLTEEDVVAVFRSSSNDISSSIVV